MEFTMATSEILKFIIFLVFVRSSTSIPVVHGKIYDAGATTESSYITKTISQDGYGKAVTKTEKQWRFKREEKSDESFRTLVPLPSVNPDETTPTNQPSDSTPTLSEQSAQTEQSDPTLMPIPDESTPQQSSDSTPQSSDPTPQFESTSQLSNPTPSSEFTSTTDPNLFPMPSMGPDRPTPQSSDPTEEPTFPPSSSNPEAQSEPTPQAATADPQTATDSPTDEVSETATGAEGSESENSGSGGGTGPNLCLCAGISS